MNGDEEGSLTPEEQEASRVWWHGLDELLSRHFGDGYDPDWMSHLLFYDVAHAIGEVWDEREVNNLLDVLERATEEIAYVMDFNLPIFVYEALRLSAFVRLHNQLGDAFYEMSDQDRHAYFNKDPEYRLVEAWKTVAEESKHARAALASARETAGTGFRAGKKNIEAWRLVSGAAKLCETRYPGVINVPKYMNEAGPFYALLCDLFLHYEIEGDVVAAFKGWRGYVDSLDAKKGSD